MVNNPIQEGYGFYDLVISTGNIFKTHSTEYKIIKKRRMYYGYK